MSWFRNCKAKMYAIILDESTTFSIQKQLCIVVWYVTSIKKAIKTKITGLVPVEDGTAEGLFDIISSELASCGIFFKDCIGYG